MHKGIDEKKAGLPRLGPRLQLTIGGFVPVECIHKVVHRFALLGRDKGDDQGPVERLVLGIARGSEPRECIWHMRKKTTKTCHSCLKDQTTNLLGDLKFDHDQMLLMISTL